MRYIRSNPGPEKPRVKKIIGVDIAGTGDWTALVGAEVTLTTPRRFRVPMLDRWHDKYSATVDRVVAVAKSAVWADAVIAVDATGVGRPVLESIRKGLPNRIVYGITFTAGSAMTTGATGYDKRCPKKDLIGAAQMLFQTGRIKIDPNLPHARTLSNELVNYTIKITPNLNETFEAGREAVNDDLVCALAMVAFLGDRIGSQNAMAMPGIYNSGSPGQQPGQSQVAAIGRRNIQIRRGR